MPAPEGNKYAEGNKGGGRPPEYKPEYAAMAYKIALLGVTDAELGGIFDVTEQTINNWKNQYEEFSLALKKGKIIADAEVAHSLHKRAIGYQYDEVTYEKIGPGDDKIEVGEHGMETIKQDLYKKKVVTKEVPPDVAAQNIWLKNRRGRVDKGAQRWADKVETGFTDINGDDVVIIFELPDNGRDKRETDQAAGGVPNEHSGESS